MQRTTPHFTNSSNRGMPTDVNRVNLPQRKYSGYIFDLDGTLVDSMPLHFLAWRKALAEAGAPGHVFDAEEFFFCGGMSAVDVVQFLNQQYGLSMEGTPIALRKREIYLHLVETEGTPPIKEVADFARSLAGKSPMAIATGSGRPGALSTLKSAGLDNLFDLIITPDDVEHGKPEPDSFLLAAERMNVNPSDCVVFEDAEPGIIAARKAHMDVILVSTPPEYLSRTHDA